MPIRRAMEGSSDGARRLNASRPPTAADTQAWTPKMVYRVDPLKAGFLPVAPEARGAKVEAVLRTRRETCERGKGGKKGSGLGAAWLDASVARRRFSGRARLLREPVHAYPCSPSTNSHLFLQVRPARRARGGGGRGGRGGVLGDRRLCFFCGGASGVVKGLIEGARVCVCVWVHIAHTRMRMGCAWRVRVRAGDRARASKSGHEFRARRKPRLSGSTLSRTTHQP